MSISETASEDTTGPLSHLARKGPKSETPLPPGVNHSFSPILKICTAAADDAGGVCCFTLSQMGNNG